MLSTIVNYLITHIDFSISLAISATFFVVNIIQAIRSHNLSKLKDALADVPEVIRKVEVIGKSKNYSSVEKKATAEAILTVLHRRLYRKNIQLFDDAIEDVLNTPQKKGGQVDVSKESEEK